MLHDHGMGLVLDIVPNHMGVMGSDNAWWLDVLENGEASVYASFFDIDWHPLKEELHGKVLDSCPPRPLWRGPRKWRTEARISIRIGANSISPIAITAFPWIPGNIPASCSDCYGRDGSRSLESKTLIRWSFKAWLPLSATCRQGRTLAASGSPNVTATKKFTNAGWLSLCTRSPEIAACIAAAIASINGDPPDPASFEELHELIKAQAFRLANWRVAADDINYRRFFDTNDLAGICVENEAVFEATHRLVLSLVAEGKVNGLRVDHPDGLYDPARYFERLNHGIAAAAVEYLCGTMSNRTALCCHRKNSHRCRTASRRMAGLWHHWL